MMGFVSLHKVVQFSVFPRNVQIVLDEKKREMGVACLT